MVHESAASGHDETTGDTGISRLSAPPSRPPIGWSLFPPPLRRYGVPHDYRCGLRVTNCHPFKICRLPAASIPAVSLSLFQIHGRPHGHAPSARTSKIHPLRIGLAKRMYFYLALASNSPPVIGCFGFPCAPAPTTHPRFGY